MRKIGDVEEIHAVDYHCAGEPFRIVVSGGPDVAGDTVAQRRQQASSTERAEHVRKLLCFEPRGHADMYGCFLTPPNDNDAALGVLFWHKDGYSTACGHGTIALATWAVESGLASAEAEGDTDIVVDVPSGRVTARVRCRGGEVDSVAFQNVPAYVLARDVEVVVRGRPVRVDVSFGGAIYGSVAAEDLGLSVDREHYGELMAIGREIKWALEGTEWSRHPTDPRLSGVYGTIIFDDLGDLDECVHQRNVTVFADGAVDRSPCGSGTSARVALLADDGRLGSGRSLRHESIVGTTFLASVVGTHSMEGRIAVTTEVRGSAYRTGEHTFVMDDRDAIGTGFALR